MSEPTKNEPTKNTRCTDAPEGAHRRRRRRLIPIIGELCLIVLLVAVTTALIALCGVVVDWALQAV